MTTASATDPRRYLRVPVQVEVIWDGGRECRAYATNFSAGGLCLQSAKSVAAGQDIHLRFRLGPSSPMIDLAAEVMWCTEERDMAPGLTYCEVGLRFLEISGDDRRVLEEFVDQSRGYQEVADPDDDSGWHG